MKFPFWIRLPDVSLFFTLFAAAAYEHYANPNSGRAPQVLQLLVDGRKYMIPGNWDCISNLQHALVATPIPTPATEAKHADQGDPLGGLY